MRFVFFATTLTLLALAIIASAEPTGHTDVLALLRSLQIDTLIRKHLDMIQAAAKTTTHRFVSQSTDCSNYLLDSKCADARTCVLNGKGACSGKCFQMTSDLCFQTLETFCADGGCAQMAMGLGTCNGTAAYKAMCTTDAAGNYCYKDLATLMAQLSPDKPSATAVGLMCKPCFRALMGQLDSIPTDTKKAVNLGLNVMCYKVNNQFCYFDSTVQSLLGDPSEPKYSFGLTTFQNQTYLQTACGSRCYLGFLKKIGLLIEPDKLDMFNTLLRFLCLKNGATFCIKSLADGMGSYSCPILRNLSSQIGCCVKSGLNVVKQFITSNSLAELQNVLSNCTDLPNECPTQSGSAVKKSIRILASWSAVQAKLAAYTTAIKSDLALSLGIPDEYITQVTLSSTVPTSSAKFHPQDTGSVTIVTVQIQGLNADQTSAIITDLTSQASSGTLTMPSTSDAYGSVVLADVIPTGGNGALGQRSVGVLALLASAVVLIGMLI